MGKRNPNGYGCVTKLKGNRSRPWVVKVTVYDDQGGSKQVPVGYAESEEKANILLAEYNNNPWDIDREKLPLRYYISVGHKSSCQNWENQISNHCVQRSNIVQNIMV